MDYEHILFQPGNIARIQLNRPQCLNAQSWQMREEMDQAFREAVADDATGAIVVSGVGGNFSAGHDISTDEDVAYRSSRGHNRTDSKGIYDQLHQINVENTLRWRNISKPTIAMVDGYCIFGGWMIAAAMDVLFASEDALFLPGHTQYFSAPWDLGPKKAKEVLLEHRFMTARECLDYGFVNRMYAKEKLERETLAYAERVAENYLARPMAVESIKRTINHMLDAQGYSAEIGTGFETFAVNTGFSDRVVNSPEQGGYARTDMAREHFRAENYEDWR